MVDMGQADRTLRAVSRPTYAKDWQSCLQQAAKEKGYKHWCDVPDDETPALKVRAREIRGPAL